MLSPDISRMTPEQIEGKLHTFLVGVEATAKDADDAAIRIAPWDTDQVRRQSFAMEAIAFELRARRYLDAYVYLAKVAETR